MNYKRQLLQQCFFYLFLYFLSSSIAYAEQNELIDLSVEDLLNVEVFSTAKKAKSLNNSPAAIFVITQKDIKRIGATSVPEALRLAPGIDVARIDANKWAISARGFNGRFANKLLVLIDGRNAYTRAFSGVYWENQDVMLEDVERIEVIRGPGASLWGANAVNGVINIITKHSADTQGGLLVAGGGTEEQAFGAFRYGGKLNSNTTARAYLKGFMRDENKHEKGGDAGDDWDKVQGGFRIDSQLTKQDNLTIQGDAYRSDINQHTMLVQVTKPYEHNFNEAIDTFGGNLLLRHQHTFSSTSDYSFQIFYDFYERDEFFLKESRGVIDTDFQHRFALFDRNDLIWGLGYRYSYDDIQANKNKNLRLSPFSRNDQLFSAFVQNEITLVGDALWLTIGSKFEHNDYSGFEVQPTARLLWSPHHQHKLWGAISKATRTPSRLEHDSTLLFSVIPPQSPETPTVALYIEGSRQFDSEQVISYELGYRTTMINKVSIDFTAFFNDYSNLRSVQEGASSFNFATGVVEQHLPFSNNLSAQSYGFEIAMVWQMKDWWRWDANYSLLKTDFEEQAAEDSLGRSPQHRVSLRSTMSPWKDIYLDILFRYVDSNIAIGLFGTKLIDDYVSMDIRLAWQIHKTVELSLVGQNLLEEQHLEYRQEGLTIPTEIDRGIYGKITWQF